MKSGLQRPRSICSVALISTVAFLSIAAGRPAAADDFRKLSGKQIRSVIVGKKITDQVHWYDIYNKDGTVLSHGMGVVSHGKWKIDGDKLCLHSQNIDDCYEIWVRGDEVQFRLDGAEMLNLTGVVRRP